MITVIIDGGEAQQVPYDPGLSVGGAICRVPHGRGVGQRDGDTILLDGDKTSYNTRLRGEVHRNSCIVVKTQAYRGKDEQHNSCYTLSPRPFSRTAPLIR